MKAFCPNSRRRLEAKNRAKAAYLKLLLHCPRPLPENGLLDHYANVSTNALALRDTVTAGCAASDEASATTAPPPC